MGVALGLGFIDGAIVAKADLNFTIGMFGEKDMYILLDFAAGIGIV